jgi:hypothetical protein
VERVILKAVQALCFFVPLMLVACSEEPNRPDRAQRGDTPEEKTAMNVEQPGTAPEGVKSFEVGPGGKHTERDVDYAQSPPVGGPHDPVWQNCGFYKQPFYTKPVRNENAVHSLEHGAVWITYSTDLPRDQLDQLRALAQSHTYLLVSPYPGLDSPLVASAWGKQLALQEADDPDLERFVRAYSQGPQTPEPGAPCYGGIGRPV